MSGPKELRAQLEDIRDQWDNEPPDTVDWGWLTPEQIIELVKFAEAWEAERQAADALAEAVEAQYAYAGYMEAPGVGDALGEYRKVRDGE